MKTLQIPIRAIGNSRGIVLPKPLLAQAGFEDAVDVTLKGGAIVLRKPAGQVRQGWAAAAQSLAEHGEDRLVMGEFGNEGDSELTW
jgi:antitoxin MazE